MVDVSFICCVFRFRPRGKSNSSDTQPQIANHSLMVKNKTPCKNNKLKLSENALYDQHSFNCMRARWYRWYSIISFLYQVMHGHIDEALMANVVIHLRRTGQLIRAVPKCSVCKFSHAALKCYMTIFAWFH